MGFRFRRSFKVMPGVKLNVSKSGLSTTIGQRGASVNIGPKRTSATVGIPGTGISYTAHGASADPRPTAVERSSEPATSVHFVNHTISTGEDKNVEHTSAPHETVYRIAAILASVLIGGADTAEAEARIAGLLPERLPNGASSPQFARQLMTHALGRDGTSYQGTAAIRRSISKVGLQNTEMVADAVTAVRRSLKARSGDLVNNRLPVEWYREDGQLKSREFEAPSIRARIPADTLADFHARQLTLGWQRVNDPELQKPLPLGGLTGAILKVFQFLVGLVVMAVVAGIVFALFA